MKEKEHEKIFKALANRRRIAIILFLKKKGTGTVGEIAEKIGLSFKSTSKHLIILLSAGFVERDQVGLTMLYRNRSSDIHISKLINLVNL